jgi:hypothetical protein
MIKKEYFMGIGLEGMSLEYGNDEIVEKTVTIRLPSRVFTKTELAAEWRSMSLEQSVEHDLFMLAIHQASNLSKCLEAQQEKDQNA